jgi:hypothetical protein
MTNYRHHARLAQQKRPISAFLQSLAEWGFLHTHSLARQIHEPNKRMFSHPQSLAEA